MPYFGLKWLTAMKSVIAMLMQFESEFSSIFKPLCNQLFFLYAKQNCNKTMQP